MEHGEAVIRQPGEGKTLQIGPSRLWLRVTRAESGNSFAVLDYLAGPAPSPGPPLHVHPEAEAFYVVAGRLTLQVGERRVALGPGGFAFVPGGTPHAFANLEPEPAHFLVTIAPAGMEGYFEELAALVADGPPDASVTVPLARRYGVAVVGPPDHSRRLTGQGQKQAPPSTCCVEGELADQPHGECPARSGSVAAFSRRASGSRSDRGGASCRTRRRCYFGRRGGIGAPSGRSRPPSRFTSSTQLSPFLVGSPGPFGSGGGRMSTQIRYPSRSTIGRPFAPTTGRHSGYLLMSIEPSGFTYSGRLP